MTTVIPSGLGATWGLSEEVTFGTAVAASRWLPVVSDKVVGSKKTAQSEALHGGLYELSSRRRLTSFDAKGAVEVDLVTNQLGVLFKHMLGSNPTSTKQGTTNAYLQVHTPGDTTGMSLTLQSGRPTIGGVITPFQYNGAKITDWELSVAAGGIAKFTVTFDAVDESTTDTYVAPSYVPSSLFAFSDATLLLGGTATTTSGVCSVAGGTAPAGTITSVDLKGTNGLDVARQNIGSLVKREQLADAFRKLTAGVTIEWANTTDMYDAYRADTPMALQLNFTGPQIATGYNAELNVLIPQVFFNGGAPTVDGPKVLSVKESLDVLDDGTNPPIQISYQTTDATV